VQLLLEVGLSMEEKVFIVEYYFCSYGRGCEGGPSLKKEAEQFQERFNKTARMALKLNNNTFIC
jgi:hypothetical protein